MIEELEFSKCLHGFKRFGDLLDNNRKLFALVEKWKLSPYLYFWVWIYENFQIYSLIFSIV